MAPEVVSSPERDWFSLPGPRLCVCDVVYLHTLTDLFSLGKIERLALGLDSRSAAPEPS